MSAELLLASWNEAACSRDTRVDRLNRDTLGQEVIRARRPVCQGFRKVLIGIDEAKNPPGEPRPAQPEASTALPTFEKDKALRKKSVQSLLRTRCGALLQAQDNAMQKRGAGNEETPQDAGEHSAGFKVAAAGLEPATPGL